MADNQVRIWGKGELLPVNILKSRTQSSYWDELGEEVALRLEQTPKEEGFRYSVDSESSCKNGFSALKRYFEVRLGKDQIVVGTRKIGSNWYLVFYRGESYGKNTERGLD